MITVRNLLSQTDVGARAEAAGDCAGVQQCAHAPTHVRRMPWSVAEWRSWCSEMPVPRWCSRRARARLVHALAALVVLVVFSATLLEYAPPGTVVARARLHFRNEIRCYRARAPSTLPDICDETPPANSIYFHETSCQSFAASRVVLTAREACAVESAALHHPRRAVYLLYSAPSTIHLAQDNNSRLLRALATYENVRIRHANFERYVNGTPLERLYASGAVELSKYASSHASDVLRYLTLWKYGGIYLDLDVVVTKNLDALGENFAGSESDANVAAGVLAFSAEGDGRRWARTCLDDLAASFTGRDWGHNGPGVITRFLKRLCGASSALEMMQLSCEGFVVHPPKSFYPIPWRNWTLYFDETQGRHVVRALRDSYIIHVWNKLSAGTPLPPGSAAAYAQMARANCPRTYAASAQHL